MTRNGDDPDELLGISAGQTEAAIGEVAATHVFGFDAGVCLPTSILQGSRDRLLSGQMMAETMLTDHESKEGNQDYDADASANPMPDGY